MHDEQVLTIQPKFTCKGRATFKCPSCRSFGTTDAIPNTSLVPPRTITCKRCGERIPLHRTHYTFNIEYQ